MTDKELLEAAAKAAGLDGVWWEMYPGDWWLDMPPKGPDSPRQVWRPLVDNGDALWLAATLKIDIHYEYNGPTMGDIVEAMSPERDDGARWCMAESTTKDAAAATRRAIVRAAAAMAA